MLATRKPLHVVNFFKAGSGIFSAFLNVTVFNDKNKEIISWHCGEGFEAAFTPLCREMTFT